MSPVSVRPGFIAVHGNRTEWLLETVIQRISHDPLGPLEPELILVQNNGMGEWVRMALAQRLGISAAIQFRLPARFQWTIYRQLLGRAAVPEQSPLDKDPLTWRIMRILAELQSGSSEPIFKPLVSYLADKPDEPLRRHQLAQRVADLFEQYQVHRPDWMQAWAEGHSVLLSATGLKTPVPAEQRWQPLLWQRLLSELDPAQRELTRYGLQNHVLQLLHQARTATDSSRIASVLPRRVIVFGITHLPIATLELLSALSRYSQVLIAIPNPCRFHWADIIDGRELLRQARPRHPQRHQQPLSTIHLEHMHEHAHPLLAAWGRQGRDFIRQLDVFDDLEQARQRFPLQRFDLFDHEEPAETLLKQVQAHIRDLDPIHAHTHRSVASEDQSIVFHIAHSPVRELEILHDQLLRLLASPHAHQTLRPRDIVVMVPDIQHYAASIRAIFGQYEVEDPRHIPFDIADLPARGSSPLISALEWLLNITHDRIRLTDLCGLFNVPAIAARFNLPPDSTGTLARWMEQAGIRWGLSAQHRTDLSLSACGDAHTAQFGLQRLLMGYAVGSSLDALDGPLPFAGIEPLNEVGGLEASLVGTLSGLVEALAAWYHDSRAQASPDVWANRLRGLIADFFKPDNDADRQTIAALDEALQQWLDQCAVAGFDGPLPLSLVGSVWLDMLERPALGRRFRAGGVTFCTLTPMRAIPFEVVCMLGMNDRDFPRRQPRADFDLIALPGQTRPGDRARRDDDRQLMLEALLSARRVLYVSWCGHSIRDNSPRPPSVLVSQLRDYLAAGWSDDVVGARTTVHPLQAFSRRYFEANSKLFTHAIEWRAAHDTEAAVNTETAVKTRTIAQAGSADHERAASQAGSAAVLIPVEPGAALSIARLTQFLRNPVKAFFRHRLQVIFDEGPQALPDEEAFSIAGLERYGLIESLCDALRRHLLTLPVGVMAQHELDPLFTRLLNRMSSSASLPLGGPGWQAREHVKALVLPMIEAWRAVRDAHPVGLQRLSLRHEHAGLVVEDWLDQRIASDGLAAQGVWLSITASELLRDHKKPTPRPEKLMGVWVRSLLAASAHCSDCSMIVGRDALLKVHPMAESMAREGLAQLLDAWLEGQQQPLPVAPRAALAFITNYDENEAIRAYEGGDYLIAEVDEPCLARCFPDFDSLTADGRFVRLAQQLYQPLAQWAQQHVEVLALPGASDPAVEE
ncbi:MAG: hypothetical protein RI906_2121 [Pseudomonadota bacterium]|jgi:exodeoxyribonuclease V gamma subunit